MAIELEGYTVYTAGNGREGLDLLSTIPAPCLILLDLMMPVMNGFEFMEARASHPALSRIPVVVVSAFAEKAKAILANGFVAKPVNLDHLFDLIKIHCAKPTPETR